MARANLPRPGLQFWKAKGTVGLVEPKVVPVVTNNTYALYPGDPVVMANTGYVSRATAGAGNAIFGIVAHVVQYLDANSVLRRNGVYVPAATTYASDQNRTLVAVYPVGECQFVGDADDIVTVTTLAAARACLGEGVDHAYSLTADTALGLSPTALDISTHGTGSTLQWRIVDVLDGMIGNDPTQASWRFVVECNQPQTAPV